MRSAGLAKHRSNGLRTCGKVHCRVKSRCRRAGSMDGGGSACHVAICTSQCRAAHGRGVGTAWACMHGKKRTQGHSGGSGPREKEKVQRGLGGAARPDPGGEARREGSTTRAGTQQCARQPYVLLEPLSSVENLRCTLADRARPLPIIAAQRSGPAPGGADPPGQLVLYRRGRRRVSFSNT